MSSQDFPTYGRGDEPSEEPGRPAVPPAQPYGAGQYGDGTAPPPEQPQQPPAPRTDLPTYGPGHPVPGQPAYRPSGQPSYESSGQPAYGQPAQPYGQPVYGAPPQGQPYGQPPQQPYYGQGTQPLPPPGLQGGPHEGMQPGQPGYAGQPAQRAVEPNPRVARLALIGGIVAAFYGLLVLTIQRTALREIAQAPGSPLNHPLRTDVIDTLGQLAVAGLIGVVMTLWLRDVLDRRRLGKAPVVAELVALGLIALATVFMLIWALMIVSTGFGSVDGTTGRLPTAYGYGGFGLWLLAAALFVLHYTLRADAPMIVQNAPNRPPWES